MSWIKSEVIAGHHVTIGVAYKPSDTTYGHIVSVSRIDTDSPSAGYVGTDVMYIEDHGVFNCDSDMNCPASGYPAIPYGAGNDSGCTLFSFGYTFDDWKTDLSDSQQYKINLPTSDFQNPAISVIGIIGDERSSFVMHSRLPGQAAGGRSGICSSSFLLFL